MRTERGKRGAFLKFDSDTVSFRLKTAVGDEKEETGHRGRDRQSQELAMASITEKDHAMSDRTQSKENTDRNQDPETKATLKANKPRRQHASVLSAL